MSHLWPIDLRQRTLSNKKSLLIRPIVAQLRPSPKQISLVQLDWDQEIYLLNSLNFRFANAFVSYSSMCTVCRFAQQIYGLCPSEYKKCTYNKHLERLSYAFVCFLMKTVVHLFIWFLLAAACPTCAPRNCAATPPTCGTTSCWPTSWWWRSSPSSSLVCSTSSSTGPSPGNSPSYSSACLTSSSKGPSLGKSHSSSSSACSTVKRAPSMQPPQRMHIASVMKQCSGYEVAVIVKNPLQALPLTSHHNNKDV